MCQLFYFLQDLCQTYRTVKEVRFENTSAIRVLMSLAVRSLQKYANENNYNNKRSPHQVYITLIILKQTPPKRFQFFLIFLKITGKHLA